METVIAHMGQHGDFPAPFVPLENPQFMRQPRPPKARIAGLRVMLLIRGPRHVTVYSDRKVLDRRLVGEVGIDRHFPTREQGPRPARYVVPATAERGTALHVVAPAHQIVGVHEA
ncbi:hypothetical protein D3C72_1523430 [compost metagenome]